MKLIYIGAILYIVLLCGIGFILYDAHQKIYNLEQYLLACLNKKGGFILDDEAFICEATSVGKVSKEEIEQIRINNANNLL